MLLNIEARLAYLAMTKTGSTSVENALRPHCHVMFTGHHRVTHMPAHHFERFIRPYLAESGLDGIETVCQVRHPIDWLESWWRYRSKPAKGERHVSTAGVSFDRFVAEYIDGAERPYLGMHRPQAFLCDASGGLLVEIVFRFEEMDLFAQFLSNRMGREITLPRHNRSPRRWARLGRVTRARAEAFFAPELEIWEERVTRDPAR